MLSIHLASLVSSVHCAALTASVPTCRSAYFRTRFRSEVGQSGDSAAIDVSGVSGVLLRTLVEAMYSHEVCCGSGPSGAGSVLETS